MIEINRTQIGLGVDIPKTEYNKPLTKFILSSQINPKGQRAIADFLVLSGLIPKRFIGKPITICDLNEEYEQYVTIRCQFYSNNEIKENKKELCGGSELDLSLEISDDYLALKLLELTSNLLHGKNNIVINEPIIVIFR